jgi:hypothetical protein
MGSGFKSRGVHFKSPCSRSRRLGHGLLFCPAIDSPRMTLEGREAWPRRGYGADGSGDLPSAGPPVQRRSHPSTDSGRFRGGSGGVTSVGEFVGSREHGDVVPHPTYAAPDSDSTSLQHPHDPAPVLPGRNAKLPYHLYGIHLGVGGRSTSRSGNDRLQEQSGQEVEAAAFIRQGPDPPVRSVARSSRAPARWLVPDPEEAHVQAHGG